MTNGSGDVSYTIKELLARQDVKLDRIEGLIASAATRDEVSKVSERVERLERDALVRGGQFSMSRKVAVAIGSFTFFLVNIGTIAFVVGAHK